MSTRRIVFWAAVILVTGYIFSQIQREHRLARDSGRVATDRAEGFGSWTSSDFQRAGNH